MLADIIRERTPIDTDVTVEFFPVSYSSRTASITGTVIDHGGATLTLGVHPDMYRIPFDRIAAIR